MRQPDKPENAYETTLNAGPNDLVKYYKPLLSVLSKVEIENCDREFLENLKVVYELLSLLKVNEVVNEQ